MGALLDLNIALDIFLARQPWSEEAAAIWKANHEGRLGPALLVWV